LSKHKQPSFHRRNRQNTASISLTILFFAVLSNLLIQSLQTDTDGFTADSPTLKRWEELTIANAFDILVMVEKSARHIDLRICSL